MNGSKKTRSTKEAPTDLTSIGAESEHSLDYLMYQRACEITNRPINQSEFLQGHPKGDFHFSNDATLFTALLQYYKIGLHFLYDEWLATTGSSSCYGRTPSEAVCRLVLDLSAKNSTKK